MAKDKKSFVLYCDLIHTVKKLPKDKAGELFIHILEYVNDEDPQTEDLFLEVIFEPIKQQFKRDLIKYENTCKRNADNGKKGGRPKKPKETQKTQSVISKPKKADSDNGSDNDTDILNKDFEWFWSVYDKKISKDKCKKKFSTLKQPEITAIKNTLEAYVRSTPDKKYRKNPMTYLNSAAWNDEIEFKQPSNQLNNVGGKSLKDLWQ